MENEENEDEFVSDQEVEAPKPYVRPEPEYKTKLAS